MIEANETLPRMPFPRTDILDIAPLYRALMADRPITRVTTLAGDEAWLVTRYEDVKALFGDERLGRSHPKPEQAARLSNSAVLGGAADNYDTEKEDHTRMRRLLTPAFSAKRMQALRSRVQEFVDELLDRMAGLPQPVDLHEEFSFPLPALVICELLGVPYSDRDRFRALSEGIADLSDQAKSAAALLEFAAYMHEVVAAKREALGEDLISDLIAAEGEGRLTEDEIIGFAVALLFAGHETTVSRIDLGTVLLLTNPAQLDALRADPALAPGAVEEIMRMVVPSSGGLPRYAKADIEIGDVVIRTGEAVVLVTAVANRDDQAFDDADQFDLTRAPNPHLGFGHGPYFCIGASLARIELQSVFSTLFERFPTLSLAVPVEQLELRTSQLTGGIVSLPVTW